MKLLQTRGIAARLGGGFAIVLVLLLAVATLGVVQARQLQQQAEQLVSRHIATMDLLGRMQEVSGERSVLLRELVLNENLKAQRDAREKLKANDRALAEVSARLAPLADGAQGGTARENARQILASIASAASKEKDLLAQVADAHFDEAKDLLAGPLSQQQQALNGLLRESFAAVMGNASHSVEANRAAQRAMLAVMVGSAALAVLLGASIAFVATRSIVRPVGEAKAATEQIAAGDLTQPIAARSQDEVGQLLLALEAMRQALAGSVSGIRHAAERVRQGSQQIEQGSGDVAERTEEQAATLEESAASMEEFTATVQQNAQGAGSASTLARDTSEVAARGGEAVRGVVATMQDIHGASTRIADIIGVIDGIAFQTNILALNAAVEAARAGEQGRGFAVVAAEVRALARRSAEAAKQIKQLIADATGRVGGGVRQVEDAGRIMDQVVTSARKVDALVADIARASAEQLAGIEQVNRAITQMDGNTQRNAAAVQQTAESARQMAEQAEALVQAVAKFKLAAAGRVETEAVDEAPLFSMSLLPARS